MTLKPMLAAAAATLSLTALPAEASHDRGRDRWQGRPAEITVRTDRGSFTVDPGDRLYWRLKSNPFKFKDGRIYEYRRCYRGNACDVLVIDPYGRQRFNRIVAPSVDRFFAGRSYGRGYGR